MTSLRQFIQSVISISHEAMDRITAEFTEIHISKGGFFLNKGRLSDKYLFLDSGFLRAYTNDENGNEVTTAFYGSRTVVFEVYSFFNRVPSKENYRALCDCYGYFITYEKLNNLFHSLPEFRDFGRAMLVKGFVALKERMLSQVSETAEERYKRLLQTNPEVFQYAPLKDIASFLGITDTSLSRIRSKF